MKKAKWAKQKLLMADSVFVTDTAFLIRRDFYTRWLTYTGVADALIASLTEGETVRFDDGDMTRNAPVPDFGSMIDNGNRNHVDRTPLTYDCAVLYVGETGYSAWIGTGYADMLSAMPVTVLVGETSGSLIEITDAGTPIGALSPMGSNAMMDAIALSYAWSVSHKAQMSAQQEDAKC